jgi:hypothetical protein
MDPIQVVIFMASGAVCGLMLGVIVLLVLSLLIGKKVKSVADATTNLADNTLAFTRTVSHLGDRVVRLGAAAGAAAGTSAETPADTWYSPSVDEPADESESADDTWESQGREDSEDAEDEDSEEGILIMTSGAAKLIEDEDGDTFWQCHSVEYGHDSPNWVDEYGPLAKDQLEEFAFHFRKVDMCCSQNPEGLPELVQSMDYTDVEHWYKVKYTFLRYYGQDDEWKQEFQDAMLKAAFRESREQMGQQAEQMKEDGILDPVEGVTCEAYAAIAAQHAQGLEQEDFLKMLADNDMDQAKYDRVSSEWIARMSQDLTGTIATIYGAAFSGAGAGQFGAAGAAAGAVAAGDGAGGIGYGVEQGAAGEAPMPLEKYAEIMGAQDAWSSQGKDVNAMLKEVFDMNALDWSNVSAWWTTHLMANVEEFAAAMDKAGEYAKQYGKVDDADEDVEF